MSIIALLTGILIPALGKVNRQAKAVICRSNLKQWGLAFSMYACNNQGSTPGSSKEWPDTLKSHYDNEKKLLCCPMATKLVSEGGRHPFAAFSASRVWASFEEEMEGDIRGSYGINGWVCNPPPEETINDLGLSTTNNWRNIDVKGASNIPLVLDSMWIDSYPDTTNGPPAIDGDEFGSGPMRSKQIRFSCINRHDRFVNNVFLDLSVRKIGFKEL